MIETLFDWLLGGTREFALFAISMVPLIELRGAVPVGIAAGMPWHEVLPICVVGNLLPIPFVLFFAEWLLDLLARLPLLRGFADRYKAGLERKKGSITKYARFGLFLFVAIPIPGTGAWSGAAIASLLKMKRGRAFASIALGVITAGLIMSLVSSGVLSVFSAI